MATYNTSEILTAAHKSTAYEFRMSRRGGSYYAKMTYRQIFAIVLKDKWAAAKVAAKRTSEVAKEYTIKISFNDHDLRGSVKKLGGKWDADSKTWTVTCKHSDLGKLESKVINSAGSISGFGFAMENTYTNRVNMMKYGYDAIEM